MRNIKCYGLLQTKATAVLYSIEKGLISEAPDEEMHSISMHSEPTAAFQRTSEGKKKNLCPKPVMNRMKKVCIWSGIHDLSHLG